MEKINLVLFKSSLYVGGAEKQLILLSKHLPREKYNVWLISNDISVFNKRKLPEDIKYVQLKYKLFKNVLFLRKFFRKNSIHICHSWDFRSSITGFFSCLINKTLFVDGSLRSAPRGWIKNTVKGLWKQRLKIFIFYFFRIPIMANSFAGLKAYKMEKYSKSNVIYNGFDFKTSIEKVSLQGDLKVGMVANMRWKKDFLTFIKAGQEVLKKNNSIHFYLIGDGIDKKIYEQFIADHKFRDHFIFTGHIDDPVSYSAEMDICVLCNEFSGEGLSNSIMEYMYCKKPVIATDLGGNSELVIDGETGFLVREKNYLELAEKILFLIDNPEKRVIMGKSGFERLKKIFDVSGIVIEYDNFYKKLSGQKKI